MGSYGAQATGVPTLYDGSGTFTPTAEEQGVAVTGRMNGAGAVAGYANGIPISPNGGMITNVENVIAGLGSIGLGALSIFGTDGALTPLGVTMIGNGAIQVFNGVDGLTAKYPNGDTRVGTGAGLTPDQEAQLTDAATGTWYDGAGVGAAVWDYASGFGGLDAQAFLMQVQNSIVNLGYAGMQIPAPGRAFLSFGGKMLDAYDPALPNLDVSTFVVGTDTALSWLTRVNPDWTVSVDSGGDTNENDYPGCVRLHRFSSAPDVIWCENDSETAVLAVGREQWFVDYDGFREYTPSSGSPARLMFADMNVLFALIPVVYA